MAQEYEIISPEEANNIREYGQSTVPEEVLFQQEVARQQAELGSDPTEPTYDLGFKDTSSQPSSAPTGGVPTPVADERRAGIQELYQPQQISPENSTAGELNRVQGGPMPSMAWYDEPEQFVGSILDGLAWGWADEAASMMHASIGSMIGEGTFSEIYDANLESMQAVRDAYADAHPVADFVGNMVGGIATSGPGMMAGKTAAKLAAQTTGKKAIAANVAGQGTVMAAEGAVSGAGSARQGERGEGAAYGAAFAPAIGGTLVGAGKGLSKISPWVPSKHVAPLREKGKPFKSIALAGEKNESALQGVGQDVLGTAWGSRGTMLAQHKAYLDPILTTLDAAKGELKRKTAYVKRQLAQSELDLKSAVDDAKRSIRQSQKNLRGRKATASEKIRAEGRREVTRIEADAAAGKAKILAYHQKIGRGWANTTGSPKAMPDEYLPGLANPNVQSEAMDTLVEQWRINGFQFIKGKKLFVNPAVLVRRMKDDLAERGLRPEDAAIVNAHIDEVIAKLGQRNKKIAGTGEQFLDLRNSIAVKTGKMPATEAYAASKSALRSLVHVIDDHVLNGLPDGTLKKQFQAEKNAYGIFTTNRRATAAASTKGGLRGDYSADDWLKANARGRSDAVVGTTKGPLQKEADANALLIKRETDALSKRTDELLEQSANDTTRELGAMKKDIDNLIADLGRQGVAENKAAGKAKVMRNEATDHATHAQLAEYEAYVEDINRVVEELNSRAPAKDRSLWAKHAATMLLGGVALTTTAFVGAGTGGVALAAGVTLAKILSTEAGQRAMAGQTGQPETVRFLAKHLPDAIAEMTRRSATRATVLAENTGEDSPAFGR